MTPWIREATTTDSSCQALHAPVGYPVSMIDRLARRYLQAANIAARPPLVRAAGQALFDALWDAGYRRKDAALKRPLG